MNNSNLTNAVRLSFYEAIVVVLLITFTYMTIEPVVGRAADTDSDTFTITQTVDDALAIANAPVNDVTMVGTLDGITGGTSYGTTTVNVTTNNALGYNLTISFSSTTAMERGNVGTPEILNFQHSTSSATYPAGFTAAAYAQFGFSVNASNTSDISTVFTGTAGTSCGSGAGSTFTLNDCWQGASSTNAAATTELIRTSAPAPGSGSTSTVQFRITIPSNPTPSVPNGTYVATATLTATEN